MHQLSPFLKQIDTFLFLGWLVTWAELWSRLYTSYPLFRFQNRVHPGPSYFHLASHLKIFHIPQPASGLSFIPHPAKPTLDPSVKSITSNQFTERNSVVIERRLGIKRPCMPAIQLCLWGLAKKRMNEWKPRTQHRTQFRWEPFHTFTSVFNLRIPVKIMKNYWQEKENFLRTKDSKSRIKSLKSGEKGTQVA